MCYKAPDTPEETAVPPSGTAPEVTPLSLSGEGPDLAFESSRCRAKQIEDEILDVLKDIKDLSKRRPPPLPPPAPPNKCDSVTAECKRRQRWSKGKNGCEAFRSGWKKGPKKCHGCAPTKRDY